jgi:hypothetical protein
METRRIIRRRQNTIVKAVDNWDMIRNRAGRPVLLRTCGCQTWYAKQLSLQAVLHSFSKRRSANSATVSGYRLWKFLLAARGISSACSRLSAQSLRKTLRRLTMPGTLHDRYGLPDAWILQTNMVFT